MGHSDYAPNLFLVAHDSFTGRIDVSRELVLCGLVTAELAHLVVERRLAVVDEKVVVVDPAGGGVPEHDPGRVGSAGAEIDDYVVASVRQQPAPHSVRVWADSLGEALYGLIAEDLVEQGVVRRERRRFVGRRGGDRFPAADLL